MQRKKKMISLLKNESAGFTLVELMVILIVLGIMLAIALPNVQNTLDIYRVKSAASEISSSIRNTQQESITQEVRHSILFESNKFTICRVNTDGTETQIDSKTLPENINLTPYFPSNSSKLILKEQGSPSEVGKITLTSISGNQLNVLIEFGRVKVEL